MNKILLDTNPDELKILRQESEDVKTPLSPEDAQLLKEMYSWVKENQFVAVGLSAIQIGVPKKMCAIYYVRSHDNTKEVFSYKLVNPKIIWHSTDIEYDTEGCLSVQGSYSTEIPRYKKIKVAAYDDIKKKTVIIEASGFVARIFQHEIDHINGKLFTDYIPKEGTKC